MTKAADKGTRIESALLEIKPIVESIEAIETKADKKIAKLEQQLTDVKEKLIKDTKTSRELLEIKERRLQKMLEGFEFPEKTRTLRFAIGEVSVKKLPDKVVINDKNKTIEKLEKYGYKTCIKVSKSVIKKSIENLDEKEQKKCGITIDKGNDRFYYTLKSSIKTSTGLKYE